MKPQGKSAARDDLAGLLPDALLYPATYPHPVGSIKLVETHMSWVALTGDFAYKIKKPVQFDFVDFSTIERRHWFCKEELRLNRSFAPELYLGVVPLVLDESGDLRIAPGTKVEGKIVEYAVKMRQFEADEQADYLVETGKIQASDLFDFGTRLAEQHQQLPIAREAKDIAGAIQGNFGTLDALDCMHSYRPRLSALASSAADELGASARLRAARQEAGFVRECHGDLHLSNMVAVGQTIQAFDCLEFDRELREIDAWNDVGFLVMDCAVRGRADLAYAFVDGYLDRTADYDGALLLPLFARYRSMVRAKVAALGYEQLINSSKPCEKAPATLARFEAHLSWVETQYKRPTGQLIVTCGLSGSGKSYWAKRLAPEFQAIRLRSDLLRKFTHGLDRLTDSGSAPGGGLYSADKNTALYSELGRLATGLLAAGENVIVDAACLQVQQREVLTDCARDAGANYVVLYLQASEPELRRRIDSRHMAGNDPSEADSSVLEWQLSRFKPPEHEAHLLPIDTESCTLEELTGKLRSSLAKR